MPDPEIVGVVTLVKEGEMWHWLLCRCDGRLVGLCVGFRGLRRQDSELYVGEALFPVLLVALGRNRLQACDVVYAPPDVPDRILPEAMAGALSYSA